MKFWQDDFKRLRFYGIIVMIFSCFYGVSLPSSSNYSGTEITPSTNVEVKEPVAGAKGTLTAVIDKDTSWLKEDKDLLAYWQKEHKLSLSTTDSTLGDMISSTASKHDIWISGDNVVRDSIVANFPDYTQSISLGASPVVIYSWNSVMNAFKSQGVVTTLDNSTYFMNMSTLVSMIQKGTKWTELGLTMDGEISLRSANPLEFVSGFGYAGVLASVLTGITDPSDSDIKRISGNLAPLLAGSLVDKSSDEELFDLFIKGKLPMVALTEQQIIRYSVQNPESWKEIQKKISVIYPAPTVMVTTRVHLFTQKAKAFEDAFYDYQVSKHIWKQHGLREGTYQMELTPQMTVMGIPTEITQSCSWDNYRASVILYEYLKTY